MLREQIKHKAKSMNVPIAETSQEALTLIGGGLMFFLVNHTKKTLLLMLLMSGSMLYVVMDYYQQASSDKVKVEQAAPVKASLLNFNGFPGNEALAGPVFRKLILIDGKNYGIQDEDFEVFKLYGEPALIVHDKIKGVVLKLEVPSLSPERIDKYRKN